MKTLRCFDFISPSTIEEAVQILKRYRGKAWPFAGGTDILTILRFEPLPEDLYPEVLVNLKNISPPLEYIIEDDNYVRIGALTRLANVSRNQLIMTKYKALAQACESVGSPHIREMGTIGGNICQITRCWYFRKENNRFYCLRKGGNVAWAIFGDNRYHSIFGGARLKGKEPCITNCPLNIDIPEYLEHIKKKELLKAAEKLISNNPFPLITAQVCPHFCEENCSRKVYDGAVVIHEIEGFLGRWALENFEKLIAGLYRGKCYGRKVAIVGAGPAGLSAAFYLRLIGCDVVVYDRKEKMGGMLSYAIPHFRLPRNVITEYTSVLQDKLKIAFEMKCELGKDIYIKKLATEFDAVLVATGTWKERSLNIPGEENAVGGITFLQMYNDNLIPEGHYKKAIVIGGGNVAADVAKTLKKLKVKDVIMICLEKEEEMPAFRREIANLKRDGIKIINNSHVFKIERRERDYQVYFRKISSFAFDNNGQLRIIPTDEEGMLVADLIVKAIGEIPDYSWCPEDLKDERGCVRLEKVEENRLINNIFLAGDVILGASSVAAAISSGKKAAEFIAKHFNVEIEKKEEKINTQTFVKIDKNSIETAKRSCKVDTNNKLDTKALTEKEIYKEVDRCVGCSCIMAHPSDVAPALLVLDARILTTKRIIPIAEFFNPRTLNCTCLDYDEIILEIQLPKTTSYTKSNFQKFRIRNSIDFPIVNCACALYTVDNEEKEIKLCLNAVAPIPYHVTIALKENFSDNEVLLEKIAETILKNANPLPYNGYKLQIARALIMRAVGHCMFRNG
ncbi:MAG: FAD binding domain-containing protein [Candidatus Bathyarchaeia archaeon]